MVNLRQSVGTAEVNEGTHETSTRQLLLQNLVGGGGGGGQMTIRGGGMCIVRINVDSICGVM